MNTELPKAQPALMICLLAVLCFGACFSATAQIQQAWVDRYNNGITNGTNQAVKMALDSAGNIYVTGFSQNANTNLGYVTIKYAPNGNQLWAARLDSTNYSNATPASLVIDSSNNAIVTGNALTIKYDANGNQLWTAPYAGTALAVDSNANVYVTGFGTQFNTVKLSPSGSNLWQTTYIDNVGPTLSQAILVDSNSNVYIAGSDEWYNYRNTYAVQLDIIKYNTDDGQIWMATDKQVVTIHGDINNCA
jgi:outer membrane protein assembly factor BamB